jgi:RNA polymerase sigma factor (sigma-70 family)
MSSGSYGRSTFVNTMSESSLDVAACVERVRRRDEDAARQLLNHLYPLVLKLVRAYLPRRSSEDDLTQIVFMKVFANLDRYSGAVPLEHWVSRIAINACLNEIAAEKIRPEVRVADLSKEQFEVIENLSATAAEIERGQSVAARELVEELLLLLDPRDRLLLTLLHLEGRTAKEVEQITGWNGIAIRVRAFRARKKLKNHFPKLMKEKAP